MIRQMEVPKEWVVKRSLGQLPRLLNPVDVDATDVRDLQGLLVFVFPELEHDGVSIYSEAGVVEWFRVFHDAIPHALYFLPAPLIAGTLLGFVLAYGPSQPRPKVADGELTGQVTDGVMVELVDHLVAAAKFAITFGDDWNRIVINLTEPLGEDATEYILESIELRL